MKDRQIYAQKGMISPVLLFLVVLFVSCMLISNILANRMIQVGRFALDAGTMTFPITYIISDIISEVYGYRWSRRVAWYSSGMNLLYAVFIAVAVQIPTPEWFDATPFAAALAGSYRIVAASLVSYILGDWVNDRIFRRMKLKNYSRAKFKIRAILSSVGGAIVDTSAFVLIAFTFIMPFEEMIPMVLISVFAKTAYEIVILPVTVKVLSIVDKLESEYTTEHKVVF